MVNRASVRELEERVMKRYENDPQKNDIIIDEVPFRANINIDSGIPYEEDGMKEARIENIFIRLVGHCGRCKATTNNYKICDRNPELEPYPTLT